MISHQNPAPLPLITQPPNPSLPQISRMAFCLNPAKTVSFPHNPTSPDPLDLSGSHPPNYPYKPPGPGTSSSVRLPVQGDHARLPPTPLLLQISHTVFCLNPAKTVSFPLNPTSPDLPGSVRITSHQLSAQSISAQNVFECLVTSARGSRPPSKDSPSAAEPPRSAEPDSWPLCPLLSSRAKAHNAAGAPSPNTPAVTPSAEIAEELAVVPVESEDDF
ncbi:hypothetical protein E4T56_gene8256 [Termitomyces sp. T112]|nr:hypothetical protein E4T56_gene8256 [Termitomyces sp. T112]